MKVLKKSEIIKAVDGSLISGYAFIKSYSKQPTKNGGVFLAGTLEAKGSIPFKVWSSSSCFNDLVANDYNNSICIVKGKSDFYGGSLSVVLDSITPVDDDTTSLKPSDFFEEKYDANAFYNVLVSTLKKNVSDKAMQVFDLVMTEDLKESFLIEFAAVVNHDACKSGLLAHSTKVVKMATLLKMYTSIYGRVGADVLFIGCALHDIGKVVEYKNGQISETGKRLPHPIIGALMIQEHEKEIVDLMGEEFYLNLLSIVSSHHGEYGEPPRTVAAYVIGQLDVLDTALTRLDEHLSGVEKDFQVREDAFKLI